MKMISPTWPRARSASTTARSASGDLPSGLSLAPTVDPQSHHASRWRTSRPVGVHPATGCSGVTPRASTRCRPPTPERSILSVSPCLSRSPRRGGDPRAGGARRSHDVDTDTKRPRPPYLVRIGLKRLDIPSTTPGSSCSQGTTQLHLPARPTTQLRDDVIEPGATFWTGLRLIPTPTISCPNSLLKTLQSRSQRFIRQTDGGGAMSRSPARSPPMRPRRRMRYPRRRPRPRAVE